MYMPHDGGIVGLVQMQPGNWAVFAPPGSNPFDSHDALTAAARFLCAHGAAQDIRGALFAYNHADWYVDDVLRWAQLYAGLLGPTLGNATTGPAPDSSTNTAVRAEIVSTARTWLGVPYHWGGSGRAGIDCSGLVMVVFAQFGVPLKHNAQLQYDAVAHIPFHLHRQRAADQCAHRRTGRFHPARLQWLLGSAFRRCWPRSHPAPLRQLSHLCLSTPCQPTDSSPAPFPLHGGLAS
jgi:hypothetical protein